MRTSLKLLLYVFMGLFLVGVAAIIVGNMVVTNNAQGKLYNDVSSIPKNKVGVILGTSKYVTNGNINLYYKHRLDAAITLFNSGKIDFILISGDNRHHSYNEPQTFKNDLIKLGAPEEKIYLDYAGFRTLDSMVRAKDVFQQEEITVISQKFHNERAVFLAEKKGLKAIGFNAEDLNLRSGFKVKIREYFARTKVFSDLLFSKQPKFLGEQIDII